LKKDIYEPNSREFGPKKCLANIQAGLISHLSEIVCTRSIQGCPEKSFFNKLLVLVRRSTAKGSKINDNQKTAMVFLSPYTWPTLRRMKPSSWNPRYRSFCAARLPKRLIGDLAYDSDPLDQELCQNHRVELIAPTRRTGSKAKTAAFSDIIVCAGSSALENPNAFSLGHTTSVAWLRVGISPRQLLRHGATCICSHSGQGAFMRILIKTHDRELSGIQIPKTRQQRGEPGRT
jgi:hypothetical protein